jgi:hypothetical protein
MEGAFIRAKAALHKFWKAVFAAIDGIPATAFLADLPVIEQRTASVETELAPVCEWTLLPCEKHH